MRKNRSNLPGDNPPGDRQVHFATVGPLAGDVATDLVRQVRQIDVRKPAENADIVPLRSSPTERRRMTYGEPYGKWACVNLGPRENQWKFRNEDLATIRIRTGYILNSG